MLQVAMSNDLGLIPVLSSKEDDKLSAPHLGEWLTFLLMAAALIALPVLVYVPSAHHKTVTSHRRQSHRTEDSEHIRQSHQTTSCRPPTWVSG